MADNKAFADIKIPKDINLPDSLQRIETLESNLADLLRRFNTLETQKDPLYVTRKVEACYGEMNRLNRTNSEIMNALKSYGLDDKWAELFTDEQIKALYMQSGLTQAEVKQFILKNILQDSEKEDLTQQMVSQYCNGNVSNILARSRIGQYFRRSMIKAMAK